LENGDLVTQSRNLGRLGSAGLKRRADRRKKCDENRTHRENHDDLPNGRNVCVINPDEVFGMDRFRLRWLSSGCLHLVPRQRSLPS
jgi:hypothetical protein